VLQVHAATAQHQRIFELQRGLQHIVGVDQNGVALAAAAGGNIIFRIALRTVFKTKTKIALFAVTIVIFKPALAAAAKVFNQRAVGGGFPQKVLAKPQAGQKTCTGTLSLLPFGEPTSGA
jgi:hypothetical protein